nr:putative reverse transcriptase domain-containing protein [Tanacetum cinerariifolium]
MAQIVKDVLFYVKNLRKIWLHFPNAPREPYVVKQDNGSFVDKISFDLNRAPDSPNKFHCFHCQDVLRDGEACKRCTCEKCGSGLGKGHSYICGHNQNSLNDTPSISETSSQSPPNIDHCCCECGNALDGIFCQQCICKSCGRGAHLGYNCPPKVPIISNLEPCNQTINNDLPQTLPSFDSVPCVLKPNFVDESSKIFNPPPQHPIYSCEFCGSNAKYGHYCTPQAQFNNPKQGYSQDFNFSQYIHDFQQQFFYCEQCGGPHKTFQCQQVNFYEPCCENCGGPYENFHYQPQEEKRIEEEQATKARYWKILACCDDDNDYDSAITPILSTEVPVNSISMGDEHLDTIPVMESDEVIKSSVEDLIPIPSEFEGIPDTMRSIANFSKIVKPLISLTQKNLKYEWGVEQEEAFQTLKEKLCNAPILSLPNGAEDFVVYRDASNQGLGCVFMQRGKSGIKEKLLAAQNEVTKDENVQAEMLRSLDQQMEKK